MVIFYQVKVNVAAKKDEGKTAAAEVKEDATAPRRRNTRRDG